MNIYIGHSSSTDFQKEIYRPLKKSSLDEDHNLVFPHEDSDKLFDSKKFFEQDCDMVVADVSKASTGLGIELGWADSLEVPILCICRENSNPSNSIKAVTERVEKYSDSEELIEIINQEIKRLQRE